MVRQDERLSVYLVGTGAVGGGLALALPHAGIRVSGMWNRRPGRAQEIERLSGSVVDVGDFGPGLRHASLVLLCVSDDAIGDVSERLLKSRSLRSDAVIAHTSGCMNHQVLGAANGFARGSIHPLVACPEPLRTAEALVGAVYVIEGESDATTMLRGMAQALGGKALQVDAGQKARYHAGAVLASNMVVALMHDAIHEAQMAGLVNSREAMVDLAMGALERVREMGPVKALTGPVSRGDSSSVTQHLQVIEGPTRDVYKLLSRRALALAEERGLEPDSVARMQELLR